MKNHPNIALLVFFSTIFFVELNAQCPTNISVNTQLQLETLMQDFPECEHLPGYLNISGSVSDLSPLASLQSVGDHVHISSDALTSLSGLGSLSSVGDYFTLNGCDNMTSLQGLENLITVVDKMEIVNMAVLTTLEGLGNLASVGGLHFAITHNPQLKSIVELTSLTTVNGDFNFWGNDRAVNIVGPSNLVSIGEGFRIFGNDSLVSITGFDTLTEVGTIQIAHDSLPFNLEGVRNIVSVAEDISLGGVGNVDFEMLKTVGGDLYFTSSLESVEGLTNLESIGDDLNFFGTHLKSLPSFPKLQSIGGDVILWFADSLEVIGGFDELTSVGGDFELILNDSLERIPGFRKLTSVGGNFRIEENKQLNSIDGFKELVEIGGNFTIANNTMLGDCSPVCPLLQIGNIAGDIRFQNNAANCKSEAVVNERCNRPFRGLTLLDANPELLSGFFYDVEDVRDLDVEDLLEFDLIRQAVAADGVTEVVLIAEFSEAGVVNFELDGVPLETPWDTYTIEVEDKFYSFGIFNAPGIFPEEDSVARSVGTPSMAEITIDVFHSGMDVTQDQAPINIVRPPVVLVHGTFASPDDWSASSKGQSMVERLENSGFTTFAVDYVATNGSGSWLLPSSFESNSKVIWENSGGIKNALEEYRMAGTAVTQADIVGHSLGGVLPRVYFSEYYNPEGYFRKENYMQGDINRLITIASTHHGSHLSELQYYLQNASVFETGPLGWVSAKAASHIGVWMSGKPLSEASIDQLPPPLGTELLNIGQTVVPSHAIACNVGYGNLIEDVFDPGDQYYSSFNYMALLFYYNAGLTNAYLDSKLELCESGFKAETTKAGEMPLKLFPGLSEKEIFKDMFIDAVDVEGTILEIMDGEWELPSETDVFKWFLSETGMSQLDPLVDIFVAGADPVGVAIGVFEKYATPTPPERPKPQEDVTEALRYMVFNNDDNDGVVRVESQAGGLDSENVTQVENVLHSFAMQNEEVQDNVIELLLSGMDHFAADGFPEITEPQKLYYPPFNVVKKEKYTDEVKRKAICQSGMVASHAEAFAQVADEKNTVIIVRPVNPDATVLIEKGAATKVMDVKPKSSNWGPQKGYLPRQQRYSKISEIFIGDTRDQMISAYNAKSEENIDNGITVARQLIVNACNTQYFVRIDSSFILGSQSESARDEVVLVPVQNPNMVCTWGNSFDKDNPIQIEWCKEITEINRLGPFEVMATPEVLEQDGVTERFLTADYDLLMTGEYKGPDNNPYDPPSDLAFKPGVGQITTAQENLIDDLNIEVYAKGYDGGNVSHHGPENQFSKSPYIDYPLTAFLPGEASESGEAEIRTIKQGAIGFRDANLKRLINEWRRKGYDLYDNVDAPGWKWTWSEGLNGFELEDSPDLNDSVDPLLPRQCNSKNGSAETSSAVCPKPFDGESAAEPTHASQEEDSPEPHISIRPNPVSGVQLSLITNSKEEILVHWHLCDMMGNAKGAGKFNITRGQNLHIIQMHNYEPGMYYITTNTGWTGRFIKI